MAFSWSTVADQLNQSLEAMLARRDLSKYNAQALGVAKEGEDRRQFGLQQDLARERMQEQMKQREHDLALRREIQQKAQEERQLDNERQAFNAMMSGIKPGSEIGEREFAQVGQFGRPEEFEQQPIIGPGGKAKYIYRKQQFEREMQELDRKQKLEEAKEQDRIEREKRQDAMEARRVKVEERAVAAAERAEKDQKLQEKKAEEALTPVEQSAIKSRAAQILKETTPPGADASLLTEAEAEDKALQETLRKRAALTGKPMPQFGPPPTPPVGGGGRGSGPGVLPMRPAAPPPVAPPVAAGAMIKLRAPDGTIKEFPADVAQHYIAKGAVVVK